MKKKMIIPIFVSHQGCPNDCVFCNQKRITGVRESFDEKKIRNYIENYLEDFKGDKIVEIAFFGGSFTGIHINLQKHYLEIAKEYIEKYDLEGIRISTRPDYINEEILDFLLKYPVKAVELGVQSLDEEVLLESKRNHKVEDVYKAVAYIKKTNIELGLQMMIGLPKDTLEKSINTAKKIVLMKPDTTRIYPTVIMKDTELETMYYKGLYNPLSLDEAIEWTSKILPLFYDANITVLRVGLQATEEVNIGKGIVAGPYHPAFRQLVEEKMLNEYILKIYNENGKRPITIYANQKLYQSLIGHKRKYKEFIKNKGLPIEFRKNDKINSLIFESGGKILDDIHIPKCFR
ncbi:elongator complex protein 3 [Defluviitalea phaphyphila]|uniref:elongator complex protein 3 n=1 Tax=Defluviitalea phaphyphila TaxID=1473580 RepID=UPI000730AE4B|nr:radical SAM protein [Defluviitalea phaphyphila]